MLISCIRWAKNVKWGKISPLDKSPECTRMHPNTLRESLAIDQMCWKNVLVTRSTRKSRGERVLYVFLLQQPKILALPICIIKGIPLHNVSKYIRMYSTFYKGIPFITGIGSANSFDRWSKKYLESSFSTSFWS